MKILIAGDFCPQNRVADAFEHRQFEAVLDEVKSVVSQADYSIVNFECPVTKGGESPIEKLGPNLQCDETGVEALYWSGFKCVTLANNHFYDYGKDGVEQTMESLRRYKIDSVGGGNNLNEASAILYKEIGGQTLAIINCCEHEFSIASEDTSGSNPLNPIQQFYAIKEARKQADYVLVIVHGGHEFYQLPSLRMQETYRFFIDAGADAVVNHHQHCYSGYEVYNGKPIFYGIGNLCFDYPAVSKSHPEWANGYMVMLRLEVGNVKYDIIPYEQSKDIVSVHLLDADSFDEKIQQLNNIIGKHNLLLDAQEDYYAREERAILSIFQPFRNRWVLAASRFKLIPSFMNKKWRAALYNIILCEAHRDKTKFFLENYKKKIKRR